MEASVSSDVDDREVWEAHVAFQQRVAQTMDEVLSLQNAVVELATSHRLVAERLAVVTGMPNTLASLPRNVRDIAASPHSRQSYGGTQQQLAIPAKSLLFLPEMDRNSRSTGTMSNETAVEASVSLSPTHVQSTLRQATGREHVAPRLSGSYAGVVAQFNTERHLQAHGAYESLCNRTTRHHLETFTTKSSVGKHQQTSAGDVAASTDKTQRWSSLFQQPRGLAASAVPILSGRALHPHSTLMSMWEGLGSLALLIDSFAAPWFLAFYTKAAIVDRIIHMTCLASQGYWTVDIIVKSMKGYWTHDTMLELRVVPAFLRYLRSWFLCDVVLVTANWMFLSAVRPTTSPDAPGGWHLETSSQLYKVLLLALWLKVLTSTRKAVEFLENIKVYMLRWESHRRYILCADIFAILCVIFNLNHVLSCLWYAIGDMETDTGSSWLITGQGESWSRQYFYATSLHWSISQMTPGSMEIVPRSTVERTYSVLVLMMGWVIATTLTGLVNSVMTGERLRIEERTKRFMLLQRYFLQENVDHALAMTANMQVKARRREKLRVRLPDVQDLRFVSKGTHKDLFLFIFGQRLRPNGFFRLVEAFDPYAFATVCSQAVTSLTYESGGVVFEEGASGDRIVFVQHGRLKYVAGAEAWEHTFEESDSRLTLEDHAWCSECALWSEWTYLGSMHAAEQSDCLEVSAAELCRCVRKYPGVASLTCAFSRAVVWVQCCGDSKWSDLAIYMDHADIIAAMPRHVRSLVGEALLAPQNLLNRGWFSSRIGDSQVKKLQEEISNGEGFVCLYNGEVVRTVFLVTLRVVRSNDNKMFVKLGQLIHREQGYDVKAACVLPGTKRKEEESTRVAGRRLVSEDFKALAGLLQVDFDEPEHEAAMQRSKSYGIRTRYLKTMYQAMVEFDEDFPCKSFDFASAQLPNITNAMSKTFGMGAVSHFLPNGEGFLSESSAKFGRTMAVVKSSANAVEEALCSINEVTILPNVHGSERHDVYAWLSESDFDMLRDAPEGLRKFLEVLSLTDGWKESDWNEEV